VSNIRVIHPPAFLVALLLIAHISTGQTLTKSTEPTLPCDAKEQIAEENHKPIRLTSDEMKRRATKKVDVGRILKNADVKATVVATVIVGKDGDVECLTIISPQHPADCERSCKVRLPVFLSRRPCEPEDLHGFYTKLLEAVEHPIFREGEWTLCERSGWPDNASFQNFVCWTWLSDRERYLVVVNLSDCPLASPGSSPMG
jgi:hypothetical protein